MALDYIVDVDDVNSPQLSHPAYRMPDEIRELKVRAKVLLDWQTQATVVLESMSTATEAATRAEAAAALAESLAGVFKLSDSLPIAAATEAASGSSLEASRADHKHPLPSWDTLKQVVPNTVAGLGLTDVVSTSQLNQSIAAVIDTVAGLSSAQGAIASGNSPVFVSIPTAATLMPFIVTTQSNNTSIMALNDAADSMTIYAEGNYTFTSGIQLKSFTDLPSTITFSIVNTANNTVITTESYQASIPYNTTQAISTSTLLTVTAAMLPLTVQFKASSTAIGYQLTGFSSTVVSATKAALSIDSVSGLATALASKLSSSAAAAVATSGQYSDLFGKPTLGTAAAKDVPTSGNATTTQVVLGTDTRLSDARTPSAHTHTTANITGLDVALAGKASTSVATTSTAGLMSATDKVKLDSTWTASEIAAADNAILATVADTVAGLASAQASIGSSTTPVLASIPTTDTALAYSIKTDSNNTAVFTLDDPNDRITLYKAGSYTFTSIVQIKSSDPSSHTTTFKIKNVANGAVLASEVFTGAIPNGNTIIVPSSTLLTVTEAQVPVTVSITVATSASGYELTGFSSVIASATKVSVDVSSVTGLVAALAAKADSESLAPVATSGSYTDLSDKPTLLSQFVNDSKFINKRLLTAILADASTVLTNSSLFVTPIELPVSGTITSVRARTASGTVRVQFLLNGAAIGLPIDATSTGVSQSLNQAVTANSLIAVQTLLASGNGLTISAEVS